MKQQCAYDFNCHQVGSYVDSNGNCFCRRHRNTNDETVVHIDWKKCTGCGQIRRLYKKKCVPCSKTPTTPTTVPPLSVCSTPRPRNREPVIETSAQAIETSAQAIAFDRETPCRSTDISEHVDNDKQMIKMLKSLSKTRPVEVTVYRFKICPPIAEETEN